MDHFTNFTFRRLKNSVSPSMTPIVLFLTFFTTARTESVLTASQMENIDDFVHNIMSCRPTPGLVVSIVKEDLTFTKAYGKADVVKDTNTSTDSIFCLASLTKAFTATLLSTVIPEKFPGTVWDTPVKDILGDSFRFVDDTRTQLTTVKDLLSHRTGLNRGDLGIYGGYPISITRKEMIKRLVHLPARIGFRDKLVYNNWMYMLAGHIAEQLEGDTWENLIYEKLLRPLKMDSTVFLSELKQYVNSTLAIPYRVVRGNYHPFPLEHYSFHPEQPAASICSTGKDMLNWMQFLLNVKAFGVIPPNLTNTSAFQATMQPHMLMDSLLVRDPPHHVYGAGFGWVIGTYRGLRLVNHNGALLASAAELWLFPEKKTGVFIAANRQATDPVLALIAYYISDILTGNTPWLNLTTACTFPEPWREVPVPETCKNEYHEPHRQLAEYTGTYGNKLFGDFEVFLSSKPAETLVIRYGKHLEGILIPSAAKHTFSVNLTGVYWFLTDDKPIPDAVCFMEADDGSLCGLTFVMRGELTEFRRSVRFNGYYSSSASLINSTVTKLQLFLLGCHLVGLIHRLVWRQW